MSWYMEALRVAAIDQIVSRLGEGVGRDFGCSSGSTRTELRQTAGRFGVEFGQTAVQVGPEFGQMSGGIWGGVSDGVHVEFDQISGGDWGGVSGRGWVEVKEPFGQTSVRFGVELVKIQVQLRTGLVQGSGRVRGGARLDSSVSTVCR